MTSLLLWLFVRARGQFGPYPRAIIVPLAVSSPSDNQMTLRISLAESLDTSGARSVERNATTADKYCILMLLAIKRLTTH